MATTKTLKPGMVVKTTYGEWVFIIKVMKTMAVVDTVNKAYRDPRGMIQIDKLLPFTAHMLANVTK